jgi:cell division protease FtsH
VDVPAPEWRDGRRTDGHRPQQGAALRRRADDSRVTFEDVAGIDEAENELVEIVDFLRDPNKYTRLGGTAPKGVLLVGAPGTGKTLLARAVAGEAGVPFFSMSAAGVRRDDRRRRRRARARPVPSGARARARDHLHRRDRLDRPRARTDGDRRLGRAGADAEPDPHRDGRLLEPRGHHRARRDQPARGARQGAPAAGPVRSPRGREPARQDRARGDPARAHAPGAARAEVDLAQIASSTPGLSGADLRNLVNEAALLAARREQDDVRQRDFEDALEKIILGPERPLLLSRGDRERIAYHEGGHAILGLVVAGRRPRQPRDDRPRGQALGVTYQRPDSDRYNYPEAYLRARIVGMLGGRAAEEIVYGTRTTGAESDIEQATALARNMVTRWGMSDALGLVQLAPRANPYLGIGPAFGADRPFSEETARVIDAEVQRIIGESHDQAMKLLVEHRKPLDALVAALLERETLDEQEILAVTGLPPAPPLESGPTVAGGEHAPGDGPRS